MILCLKSLSLLGKKIGANEKTEKYSQEAGLVEECKGVMVTGKPSEVHDKVIESLESDWCNVSLGGRLGLSTTEKL